MKKISLTLITALVLSNFNFAAASFSDVDTDHANYDAINYVQAEKIVSGHPDGSYRADDNIDRAAFTKIIVEAYFSQDEINACKDFIFSDVKVDEWYAPYICVAAKNKVISGYPDKTFKPAAEINLAEASKIISETFGYDIEEDAIWYKPYVMNLEGRAALPESLTGFEHKVTRGEMAEMVYRLLADVTDKKTATYADLNKIDDWALNLSGDGGVTSYNSAPTYYSAYSAPSSSGMFFDSPMAGAAPSPVGETIGFSVGGAKDINNLRENIENDFLPIPDDVTYEGLFYDYFFDTGPQEACNELFCPSYSSAISKDPFSEKDEYFLSVGLNSGIRQEDFARKKLNLMVVIDISGSMSSPFNQYYYDQFGVREERFSEEDEGFDKTKMEVARESVVALMNHLEPEDRLGVVLFDDQSYLAKPLNRVGDTNMAAIKGHVLELQPDGGTNMSAGMQKASEQFEEYLDVDSSEFENRIIFITDAQPNTGDISEEGLLGISEKNAKNKVYTSFVGVGVDFNTELIESISKVRGANYYSVHSPLEFKERMDEGFDYMVTPLVFDLQLNVNAPGFDIERVYGSPQADEATGEIMKVETLFPSEKSEGETRGGLVLLHMKRISDDNTIELSASYEDRNGEKSENVVSFEFEEKPEFYENTGIRKGIVLVRYANLLKNWIVHERGIVDEAEPVNLSEAVYYHYGIPILPPQFVLGEWERQSEELRVSEEYKNLFDEFIPYFESEMEAVEEAEAIQELDLLDKLASYITIEEVDTTTPEDRDRKRKADLYTIAQALEFYASDFGYYPGVINESKSVCLTSGDINFTFEDILKYYFKSNSIPQPAQIDEVVMMGSVACTGSYLYLPLKTHVSDTKPTAYALVSNMELVENANAINDVTKVKSSSPTAFPAYNGTQTIEDIRDHTQSVTKEDLIETDNNDPSGYNTVWVLSQEL